MSWRCICGSCNINAEYHEADWMPSFSSYPIKSGPEITIYVKHAHLKCCDCDFEEIIYFDGFSREYGFYKEPK